MRKNGFLKKIICAAAVLATLFVSAPTALFAEEAEADAAAAALAILAAASSSTTTDTKDQSNQSTEEYKATPADDTGYVALGNTYITPNVSAGQTVTLVVPIVNYSFAPLTNIVVTPQVSNKVTEWPFEAGDLNYTQTVPYMSAYSYGADVNATRAEVVFTFQVRDDVLTGFYPINFNVTFLVSGQASGQSKKTITAYVYAQGKAGSGRLEDSLAVSKPRIIVTGFETDPERINAGDTFRLTVHIQNTSSDTAVSNVLFDFQADSETTTSGSSGTSTGTATTTYAAFLPTSGASSVYESTIGAGQTVDLSLEMQARADLTQKPHVLLINMTYDAAGKVDYTDKASLSIPVWQKSKFDTGEESIPNPMIAVGEEGSLSFSIYNTGRTTLNNVWFRFKDDAVTAEDVFAGTITSGGTGYVDASFTGAAENDGVVHAVIEYEDDAGNVTSVDKDFEITVTGSMDEMGDESMYYEEMPEDMGGFPRWAIVLIVVAAAVAAVVVLLLLRKKKAKKAKEDSDDDLFEEDTEEKSGE